MNINDNKINEKRSSYLKFRSVFVNDITACYIRKQKSEREIRKIFIYSRDLTVGLSVSQTAVHIQTAIVISTVLLTSHFLPSSRRAQQ
jgi:hypothetical protein